jgi:hypothetical protein
MPNLREIDNILDAYPILPDKLRKYFIKVVKDGIKNDLTDALSKESPKKIIENIVAIISMARQVCKLDPEELFKKLDFNPNDMRSNRINSLFAELRVINRLHEWNFIDINPLESIKVKRADIICQYAGIKCAVEVFCSPQNKYRYPNHSIRSMDLTDYYESRALKKRKQLENTALEFNCSDKILCLVFDSLAGQATLVRSDFSRFAKTVYNNLNWPSSFHIMIMTSKISHEGSDDVIFPPISASSNL